MSEPSVFLVEAGVILLALLVPCLAMNWINDREDAPLPPRDEVPGAPPEPTERR